MSDQIIRRDLAMEKVADLRFQSPQMYGRIVSGLGDEIDFDRISVGLENGVYKPSNKPEGDLFSAMRSLGLVEAWGGTSRASPPHMTDNLELVEIFLESLSEFDSYFTSEEEIIGSLRAANRITEKDNLSKREFNDLPGPGYNSARSHFGSWNRALFWAGTEREAEEIASEDIRDRFRKKFYEVDGFSTYDDFLYSDPRMPTETQLENSDIDSYEELCRSEFPVRYGVETNYDNTVDKLSQRKFEKGKWVSEPGEESYSKAEAD